ncbi:MAG: hypothetical protein AAB407_00910 [Patescibacteria group bacterium]
MWSWTHIGSLDKNPRRHFALFATLRAEDKRVSDDIPMLFSKVLLILFEFMKLTLHSDDPSHINLLSRF